ncbi:Ig-like domain-containing protein [Paenibacillus sp. NAIST15-1]|uniref:Ig-like domain-containing protein n=1 Tax=Paenibacillus sp. NAIST15-1 TaxID=1605994 RepID=UPI00086B635E|nr:Ig-like domain-containing protein [Paenibacillus sp. NAIST15-1]GAV10751.1 Ig domain protein group 2 domain protein [Paenibacillus sp. NAIST15-1]
MKSVLEVRKGRIGIGWLIVCSMLILALSCPTSLHAQSDAVSVTYGNQPGSVKEFVKYDVSPSNSVTLGAGSSKSIKVYGYESNGKKVSLGSKVQWQSGNEQVVKMSGATIKGVAEGSTIVTGVYGQQRFDISVHVTATIKKLIVTPTKVVLSPGKSAAFSVQAVYAGGSTRDVTSQVTAKASGQGIDVGSGVVTAVGQPKGSVSVKLYYGGKGVTLPVVLQENLVSIDVQPTSLVVEAGAAKPIKVIGTLSSGKKVSLAGKIAWKSGNDQIAKVTVSGVKGLTEGTTRIVGVYGDRTFEIPVQVTPKLKKLTVVASTAKLAPHQSTSYRVQAVYSSGNTSDVTSLAKSKSNGKATANQGMITAVSKGKAVLTFSYGGKQVSLRITVE